MENFSQSLLLKQLRDRLNAEKVKLWLPPYTTENKEKGETPESLISRYSEELKFAREEISQALEDLRLHALAKLEEREKFQKQGLATLRVKLASQIPTENGPRKPVPVECNLESKGADLKNLVGVKFDVSPALLRLICRGRVVDDKKTLAEQGIKNGSDVMAMSMTSSEAVIVKKEAEISAVERTRQAAELLSAREDDDEDFDIQIADQHGKPLSLPREEKKALTLAMTLHEKGRAALKNKKVSLALPLFLEADAEFSKCSSEILNSVDNYAILCLDIVWCYLMLKNMEQLPDAETRLKASETCFKRSYGEKMERLAAIKGGTGTEQALFMRLYLLQGIVAFHKGEIINAQNLLRRAEFVLSLLHVDEGQLNEIMVMGFTESEARLGLRAKNGNVQQAVDHIIQRRKELEEANKKAKKEWYQRVRGKKLGKTSAGQQVNVEHFDSLVSMSFPPGGSAEALRQANNDIGLAVEILNAKPELYNLPDPERKNFVLTDEMIQQILSMGFDVEMAKRALTKYRGNIQRAADALLKNNGFLPPPSSSASSSSVTSNSSSASSSGSEMSTSDTEQASSRLNINTDANDHLDLTLTEEREFLHMYQGLLDSLPSSS